VTVLCPRRAKWAEPSTKSQADVAANAEALERAYYVAMPPKAFSSFASMDAHASCTARPCGSSVQPRALSVCAALVRSPLICFANAQKPHPIAWRVRASRACFRID
jgi:hypothetical protein